MSVKFRIFIFFIFIFLLNFFDKIYTQKKKLHSLIKRRNESHFLYVYISKLRNFVRKILFYLKYQTKERVDSPI